MPYETLYLRLPSELKEWLKREADKQGVSMTDVIIKLIERGMAK